MARSAPVPRVCIWAENRCAPTGAEPHNRSLECTVLRLSKLFRRAATLPLVLLLTVTLVLAACDASGDTLSPSPSADPLPQDPGSGTASEPSSSTPPGTGGGTASGPSVDPQGQVADLNGTYDLAALITASDPAWGIPDSTQQIAVLTIRQVAGSTQLTGTFSGFTAVSPGETYTAGPGSGALQGSIGSDGQVIIELTFAGSGTSYWYGRGWVTADAIRGAFGAGGHISGTFVARRRPPG